MTSISAKPRLVEVRESQKQVDCGIVVVTYNSARQVERLLDSIPEASRGLRTRCVVIDNDSQDETVSIVRSRGDAELIEAGGNLGYSGAINIGRSFIGPCASLLILNPDLVLEPGAITELYEALSMTGVGVTVPMLRNDDDSLYLSLRREPTLLGTAGDALFGDRWPTRPDWLSETTRDKAAYQTPRYVEWASGAALLVSAACDKAVGEWDANRFFLYAEEIDFAARVRSCGFHIRYIPTSRVRHEGGGSGGSFQLRALMSVNRIRYYEKYNGRFKAYLFRGIMAFHHLLRSYRRADRFVLKILLRRASWCQLPHHTERRNRADMSAESSSGVTS